MGWYAFLLYPLAAIYDLVTRLRNLLFDLGWKKSELSKIPSIVVGNLSVGGTGKTPMVEFLIRMFKDDADLGVLSRGYGRKSKGFLAAHHDSTPTLIGDEPFQIFQKFKEEIPVFVGEDRLAAIDKIYSRSNKPNLLILDDAFQHRHVVGNVSVLLTTYQKPFFIDYMLPMGRLRESRTGANRADVVVVTKCPKELSETKKYELINGIERYVVRGTPIVFSYISYGAPICLEGKFPFFPQIILLTGLADDRPLVEYVSENFILLETMSYPDHHDYGPDDFKKIRSSYQRHIHSNPVILTTEKDAVKVKSNAPKGFLKEFPIFVLPIAFAMSSSDQILLEELIQQKVFNKG